MSKEERCKLLLFMVIRNNFVLPKGMELGKTEEEICEMTKDTMREMERMIDFRRAKELYEMGR